jgi:hypothetical protein
MHLSTRRDLSLKNMYILHSHKTRGMSFDCLLIRLRPRGIDRSNHIMHASTHACMYDDEPESDAHKAGTDILVHTWTHIIFHLFRGRGRWVICESVSTSMMLQLRQTVVPTRYARIGIAPEFFDRMIYEWTNVYNIIVEMRHLQTTAPHKIDLYGWFC